MSQELMQQLQACALKLGTCAEKLQQKIKEKKEKNKHYASLVTEANRFQNIWGHSISQF